MFFYLFKITCLFIVYVEYTVGSISFRPTSSGKVTFQLQSLLSFLVAPFSKSILWTYSLLDINYVFVILLASLVYLLLN